MKRTLIGATVIALLVLGGWWLIGGSEADGSSGYKQDAVTRGSLENIISSTGVLSPVTTVEIGTQVSGTIANVLVDFNDLVAEGQLLTVLDTVLLKASVLEAEAGLERTEAQLVQARSDFDRYEALFDQALISEAEYLPFSVALTTATANVKSSKASLARSRSNLEYAVITSPISGTVIERNVEAGQTVAASLSTPTLFLIAEDLSRMEILVDVDESDIGEISEGLSVKFEVPAYPDDIFTGSVSQVRLQPKTISNVVTYTVVVEAGNDGNRLLPGMTATVDFIIESREDVLLIPNSALRFQPSEAVMASFQERRRSEMEALPDSVKAQRRGRGPGTGGGVPGNMGNRGFGASNMPEVGRVWYLDEEGQPAMAMLRTGISDGSSTEVLRSRHLTEGTQVITGNVVTTSTSSSASSGFGGGRPPGGRGF
ncbi:MAG: efflux RND transporter periplasmic adaptor subunit [bacterium]|nr:efflux RND transporter periplasmic adaptor subunit [bacterium]